MNKLLIAVLMALFTFGVTGCATRTAVGVGYGDGPHYHKEGPPPHAPAHGYRHKYHQHDYVYDSKIGAYVVLGYDDHFYIDELYYRYRDGGWQVSVHLDGHDWRHIDDRKVPYKLRKSKAHKHKDKGKKEHNEHGKKWDDD